MVIGVKQFLYSVIDGLWVGTSDMSDTAGICYDGV